MSNRFTLYIECVECYEERVGGIDYCLIPLRDFLI